MTLLGTNTRKLGEEMSTTSKLSCRWAVWKMMISLLVALATCIVVSMTVSSSPESCQEAPALEDTVNDDLLERNGRSLCLEPLISISQLHFWALVITLR